MASGCKAGQRVVLMPPRLRNEQLQVQLAALNGDLHYYVVLTNGGVACTFLVGCGAAVASPDEPASAKPSMGAG